MGKNFLIFAAALLLFNLGIVSVSWGASQEVSTQTDSSAEILVNLLLKKGILNQEEATQVLGEMEEIERDQAAKLKKIPEKGTVVSGRSGKKHVLTGVIHGDARFGDSVLRSPDNTAEIRRARLALKGEVVDHLEYEIKVDAAKKSGILKDAEIELTHLDWASLKLGQYKAPFGREELTSSSRIDTLERSVVSEAITPGRQIGGSVYGKLFDEILSYAFGIFNGNGANTRNDDNSFLYVGRLILTPFKSEDLFGQKAKLELGGNLGTSEDTNADLEDLGFEEFKGNRDLMGIDGMFAWGPFFVKGEYLRAELEFDGLPGEVADPEEFVPAVEARAPRNIEADGYSLIGSYFLIPKKVQAVAKWETFHLEDEPDFDALTLGLNYYFTEYDAKGYPTRFMVNYVHGGEEGSSEEDQVLLRMQVGY